MKADTRLSNTVSNAYQSQGNIRHTLNNDSVLGFPYIPGTSGSRWKEIPSLNVAEISMEIMVFPKHCPRNASASLARLDHTIKFLNYR